MVIYGRNPVKEALRGKRKVHRIWATHPEDWAPQKVTVASAEEIEERAESDAHQGVCALVDPYPYADAAELLEIESPLFVALDEITDPQNLGRDLPHGGGRRRDRGDHPRATQRRGDPRRLQGAARERSSTSRSPA